MRVVFVGCVLVAGCFSRDVFTRPEAKRESPALRSVAELSSTDDAAAKSLAAFTEASKVILHPRCVNCHPPDDRPRQRDLHEIHDPPALRGPSDRGIVGMECATCHQDANVEATRVPGAPKWHLAPLEMVWLGRSAAQICNQLKDPKRNGGKTLEQIVEHSAHDELVGWAWHPGADREPAPGTQARFGELMAAWANNGAVCPEEAR
jgi:hypothetical protein